MSRNVHFSFVFFSQKSYNYGMKISKKSMGFNLVEIVIVIGIMGVLSAIIYSSFNTSRAKSRDQKRISDISALQLSLEQYFQKNGVYPLTLEELATAVPPFISSIPVAPNPGEVYNYLPITKTLGSEKSCISYQLWTKFELSNAYLNAKKEFNSTILPTSSIINGSYECGTGHLTIDASNSVNPLVYDVMP